MNYKLVCTESNERHTRFSLFDRGTPGATCDQPTRANCGMIAVDTRDLLYFLKYNWNGDIDWRGRCPDAEIDLQIAKKQLGATPGE